MNYIKMYLDKAKEHGFNPRGAHEIIRYLIVNGLIPATDEHLEIMGDYEFFVDADKLPEKFINQANKAIKAEDGEYHEETELDILKVFNEIVEGAWIKNGEITSFKTIRKRHIEVETTYIYSKPE